MRSPTVQNGQLRLRKRRVLPHGPLSPESRHLSVCERNGSGRCPFATDDDSENPKAGPLTFSAAICRNATSPVRYGPPSAGNDKLTGIWTPGSVITSPVVERFDPVEGLSIPIVPFACTRRGSPRQCGRTRRRRFPVSEQADRAASKRQRRELPDWIDRNRP